MPDLDPRRLETAELLSIGTELTVGDTRDTNSGELARMLAALGVRVSRLTALPDDLAAVTDAFRQGLERSDLVVSTGGLGPTPDDLTREAIAGCLGETPVVDPDLEAWLRDLFARRGTPFPELNLKQAWLIPSATGLANPNGTAPGWFVTRSDGRTIVALPGPPREMRPMWANEALPRLRQRGLGNELASRTYRLTGIGESMVADLIGEAVLRGLNPTVATYARADALDVRVSAVSEGGRSADDLVEEAANGVLAKLGDHVWATGSTTWSEAIGARLQELGWTLAVAEIGTAGSLNALLGDVGWLRLDESILLDDHPPDALEGEDAVGDDLVDLARHVRERAGAALGLAARARPRGGDTHVEIAILTPIRTHRVRRLVFLDGPLGRSRVALAVAAVLLEVLRDDPAPS